LLINLEIENLLKEISILEETACSRLELSDIIEVIEVSLFLGISGFVVISIILENEELFLIF
jgi:hypothetical protein